MPAVSRLFRTGEAVAGHEPMRANRAGARCVRRLRSRFGSPRPPARASRRCERVCRLRRATESTGATARTRTAAGGRGFAPARSRGPHPAPRARSTPAREGRRWNR
jgi:hypothetical protein